MNKEEFDNQKNDIIKMINDRMGASSLTELEKDSLIKVIKIINDYNFNNRIKIKGLLSKTIIDSLELDYFIGEKLINFDNNIS
ncbi:hypothetical protein UJ101_01530 [Flavobacteriaceae bacterium UJ101]|nr:hypothetical protein UJ101_01530 [Flavobacteriaceae bacterium UJ101]